MKADVLHLVDVLSNFTADPTVTTGLYDDIIQSWAYENILTTAVTQPVLDGGGATQVFAPHLITVTKFIWDNRELGLLPLREVESLDPGWRNRTGIPNSFITETEQARTLRIYPAPDINSDPDLGTFGEPIGRDYPAYMTVMIGSEQRADVPTQYELPLALLVLSREMSRESDHTDLQMAAMAAQFGAGFLAMARGLPLPSSQ